MAKNMAIQTLKRAKSAEELQEHLKNMTDEDLQSFYDEAKKIPEDQAYKYEEQLELVEEYMVERGLIKPQKVAPAPQSEMAKGAAVFNKARATINSGEQLELTDDELELLRSYLERMHESLVDHTVENHIAKHFPATKITETSTTQGQNLAAQKSEETLQTQGNQEPATDLQNEVPQETRQSDIKTPEMMSFKRAADIVLESEDIPQNVAYAIAQHFENIKELSSFFNVENYKELQGRIIHFLTKQDLLSRKDDELVYANGEKCDIEDIRSFTVGLIAVKSRYDIDHLPLSLEQQVKLHERRHQFISNRMDTHYERACIIDE